MKSHVLIRAQAKSGLEWNPGSLPSTTGKDHSTKDFVFLTKLLLIKIQWRRAIVQKYLSGVRITFGGKWSWRVRQKLA